jgi:LytS/YehU family sensor histidine kinase
MRAERLERQLAAAELRALRMLLDPHFLFNAFTSIASLQTQPREASRVLSHLASFLRLTLESKGRDRVRLAEELEFVRSYLEVERARFRDNLVAELAAGHAPMDALVPSLILQPLVENAARHGGGTVQVAAESDAHRLTITVSDDGPGFPDNAADGVGLANTRARLRELYGPRRSAGPRVDRPSRHLNRGSGNGPFCT